MLGICWLYFANVGYMLAIWWVHVGYMLDSAGYMLAICWVHVGYMLDNDGYMLAIRWVYVGYMLGICLLYVG